MAAAESEPKAPDHGPLARYRTRVASGELKTDSDQQAAVARLDELSRTVDGWQARSASAGGWLSKLGLRRSGDVSAPTGVYLFGPVGRGKSMLMDLFCDAAPVAAKRRVHFHEFMQEVHGLIHRFRQQARPATRRFSRLPWPWPTRSRCCASTRWRCGTSPTR